MLLRKQYLTNNDCYKAAAVMRPRGIMVHSTGANNPNLKRYIAPNDGIIGVNQYNNHWNQSAPDGTLICCHAFIGKGVDGNVYTYQTLPWNYVGWHSGTGSAGYVKSANNTGYIGFEICEDGLDDACYFNKVYASAADLCAYLCDMYGISPVSPQLICHKEGADLGIASNHGDIVHWLSKFGKTMSDFRRDTAVKLANLQKDIPADKFYRIQVGAYNSKTLAEDYLTKVKALGLSGAFISEVSK